MGQRAEGMGHGAEAWGMGQKAWGMVQRAWAWGIEQRAEGIEHSRKKLHKGHFMPLMDLRCKVLGTRFLDEGF